MTDSTFAEDTTTRPTDVLLDLLDAHMDSDHADDLRRAVLDIDADTLATLSGDDWARVEAGDDLSPEASHALHRILAAVFGGRPDELDPDQDEATLRARDVERFFGITFANAVRLVPAPRALRRPVAASGEAGLIALCDRLPRVSGRAADALLATPALLGCADAAPSLAKALAKAGLTPAEFRDGSRAVAATVLLAYAHGRVPEGATVTLRTDGRLAGAWAGDRRDALRAVTEATELGRPQAEAVLQWLVSAAEVAPGASLFPMVRTAAVGEGLELRPDPTRQAADADDPIAMWERFIDRAPRPDPPSGTQSLAEAGAASESIRGPAGVP